MTSRRNVWAFGLVFVAGVLGSVAAEPGRAREAGNERIVTERRDAEQRKESEREREEGNNGKQPGVAPRPDPFEPFLRDWMSPRHRIQQPTVSGATVSPSPLARSLFPERPAASPNSANSGSAPATQENPYLKAMTAPPPAGVMAGQTQVPAHTRLETRAAGEEGRAAQPTLTAPEAPVRAPSAGYRPPPAKDAKYFPQQKRF